MADHKTNADQNTAAESAQNGRALSESGVAGESTARAPYRLSALMAEMPQGFPRAEGWENLPPAGMEVS